MAVDPQLPRRLRALGAIRRGEQRVARAWYGSVSNFLDRVRPQAMAPGAAGGAPDASAARSNAGLWRSLVEAEVMPEIANLFRNPYQAIDPDASMDSDPYATAYLNGVRNRLQGVPDQVFSLIVAEIERGVREGSSIPDISANVQRVLTASATPYWQGRATTVARTETIGATNAGAFAAAVQRAYSAGDDTAEKVWLSTLDDRTRETHRDADQQRVPLLQTFTVGGAGLQFPGDPTGPAQEVINCRCTLLAVVAGEELDWTNRQFLERDEL